MTITHGFFRLPQFPFQSPDELLRRLQLDKHFRGGDRFHLRSGPRDPERVVRPGSELVLRHRHWLVLDLGWHSFFKDLGIAESGGGLECGHLRSD